MFGFSPTGLPPLIRDEKSRVSSGFRIKTWGREKSGLVDFRGATTVVAHGHASLVLQAKPLSTATVRGETHHSLCSSGSEEQASLSPVSTHSLPANTASSTWNLSLKRSASPFLGRVGVV
jgi:hypothetical protein